MKVFEVSEHDEIGIPLEWLLVGGEIRLDERIANKGYLSVAFSDGRLRLRATRFVGLIPLGPGVALRVKPKVSLANLSRMLVRSGNIPGVIENFSRGYRPRLTEHQRALDIYHAPYLRGLNQLVERGVLKSYINLANPPPWRGRLLASETASRFIAKGIRFQGAFDVNTLSPDNDANRILKAALVEVLSWLSRRGSKFQSALSEGNRLMRFFAGVSDPLPPTWRVADIVPTVARSLPSYMSHYREPLWTAYAILEGGVPDILEEGYLSLESMIVDVSAVFEAYARSVLREWGIEAGWQVIDGNIQPTHFFSSGEGGYQVKPDIVLRRSEQDVAVFDVKYKPAVKEQDRYEMLAFMEATGVSYAAFICPKVSEAESSRMLGTTSSGRRMAIIRFDLGASDLLTEEEKLITAVEKVTSGQFDF